MNSNNNVTAEVAVMIEIVKLQNEWSAICATAMANLKNASK